MLWQIGTERCLGSCCASRTLRYVEIRACYSQCTFYKETYLNVQNKRMYFTISGKLHITMAEAAIDDLNEIITCAVCLSPAVNPKIIQCYHSFCLCCIQKVYDQAIQKNRALKGQLTCPMCQQVTRVMNDDLSTLTSDFRATQLTGVIEKFQTRNQASQHKYCYICSKAGSPKISNIICFNCSKTFCRECHQKLHGPTRRYKNHLCSSIDTDQIETLVCQEHQELVQEYCVDCAHGVCEVCLQTSHEGHRIEAFVPSDDTWTALRNTTRDMKQKLEQALTDIEVLETKLELMARPLPAAPDVRLATTDILSPEKVQVEISAIKYALSDPQTRQFTEANATPTVVMEKSIILHFKMNVDI